MIKEIKILLIVHVLRVLTRLELNATLAQLVVKHVNHAMINVFYVEETDLVHLLVSRVQLVSIIQDHLESIALHVFQHVHHVKIQQVLVFLVMEIDYLMERLSHVYVQNIIQIMGEQIVSNLFVTRLVKLVSVLLQMVVQVVMQHHLEQPLVILMMQDNVFVLMVILMMG